MSVALHTLVPDPAVPPDLAERVVRRFRRRRARLAAAATATVLLAGGAGIAVAVGSGGPDRTAGAAMLAADDLRAALRGGRFTQGVSFDDGALTVLPPGPGEPRVARDRAISLFRSTGMPAQTIRDVAVGYGVVSLAAGLRTGAASRVIHRPSWVIVYRTGPHSCPPSPVTGPRVKGGEGRRVFLLDSDSGDRAFEYQEAGVKCGTPHGPAVSVARQYVSLPWTEVRREKDRLTVRYQTDTCTERRLSGLFNGTLQILGARPIRVATCSPSEDTLTMSISYPASGIHHAPTGPTSGFQTRSQPAGFDFYDGS